MNLYRVTGKPQWRNDAKRMWLVVAKDSENAIASLTCGSDSVALEVDKPELVGILHMEAPVQCYTSCGAYVLGDYPV